jgi:hypothetical protein
MIQAMLKRLLAAAWFAAVPAALAWNADEVDFPGDVQGWVLTLDSAKYTGPDGSPEWFRYTFTSASNDSPYYFKMVTGNDWNKDYGGNAAFPKDTVSRMFYDPVGDSASQLAGGISNGFRYIFTAKNPGLNDTDISIMELSGDPVAIASVTGGQGSYQTNDGVVITVVLASNPPPQQKVFIRYTTNNYASFRVVGTTISSNVATAVITNLAPGKSYIWYALTSTASSNYLASTNDFCVDALTLNWNNNGGTNYTFGTVGEAAWMWHNNNRVTLGGSNAQCWVKMGYANGDGSDRWVSNAAIYYSIGPTSTPAGAYGGGTNGQTSVIAMSFDHTEQDESLAGESMWWVGTMTNLPLYTTIKYRIGAWMTTNDVERFADYNTSGTNNAIFSFSIGATGTQQLTVNGVVADYATTKFFLDEIAGDTQTVTVVYTPGVPNVTNAEIFSNLDRRDLCDIDYTSALISADGYADGIVPPDGALITVADTGAYFRSWTMPGSGGTYTWTGRVSRCGAYRLTARFQTNGSASWHWYSDDAAGRRDHAIVATPKKALAMTLYELNPFTIEATAASQAGRSTFRDLLAVGDAGGDDDAFDPFNLAYLDSLAVNCLWFQPIHPNGYERAENDPDTSAPYAPGSPYATKNYYAVNGLLGSDGTEATAFSEFTNFVAQCDSHAGTVGTINVMLDGVFNHTSWDAIMGTGAVDLGFAPTPTNRIGHVRPQWYALISDYGTNASYYNSAYDNNFATAPDRGDFGKWSDVTELFFGRYSALVRHNPENNGDYLNEGDVFDFTGMSTYEKEIWKYFAYYTEYWLKKTGHAGTNTFVEAQDDKGIDALRCDFGQGLPPQLWEYIINRTRRIKWNFVFMAETLDGGVPGYRSNRHFDILNENLVFQFTQTKINDSRQLVSALESRRTAYSGGAILLNLTSHDEVLPDDDPWIGAARYGAVSSVDGLPMLFYGQEQGIKNYNATDPTYDGFVHHELNFGKYIPHFKRWNQLTVWTSAPPDSFGLSNYYAKVNRARLSSPALRSQNRYFLDTTGGGQDARILAVAKYQASGASPRTSDVVIAFTRFLEHGASHTAAANTYNLQPAWNLLGLDVARQYRIRNLAASDPSLPITSGWPRTGADMYDNGIYVYLDGGGTASITNDGAIVQYLKIEEELDYDGDGLPVDFELQYGLSPTNATGNNGASGDPDTDGMNNWQEYIAGTNPTNGASFFEVSTMVHGAGFGSRLIRAATEPAKRYGIRFADGGYSNNMPWAPFANTNNGYGTWLETNASSTTYTFIDDYGTNTTLTPPASGQRNYRVIVE